MGLERSFFNIIKVIYHKLTQTYAPWEEIKAFPLLSATEKLSILLNIKLEVLAIPIIHDKILMASK